MQRTGDGDERVLTVDSSSLRSGVVCQRASAKDKRFINKRKKRKKNEKRTFEKESYKKKTITPYEHTNADRRAVIAAI